MEEAASLAEDNVQEEITAIKIEEGSRYLLTLQHPGTLSEEAAQRLREAFHEAMRSWWGSGEKFGWVLLEEGMTLHVKRIDAPVPVILVNNAVYVAGADEDAAAKLATAFREAMRAAGLPGVL